LIYAFIIQVSDDISTLLLAREILKKFEKQKKSTSNIEKCGCCLYNKDGLSVRKYGKNGSMPQHRKSRISVCMACSLGNV